MLCLTPKWVEFSQNFTFVIKNTSGKSNKVVDSLSKVNLILQEIKVNTLGFEYLVNMYKEYVDFKDVYTTYENPVPQDRSQWLHYILQEGLLFKSSKLCIPKCSMRENMIQQKHRGGLSGHFGQDKTFAQVSNFFFCQECSMMYRNLLKNAKYVNMPKGGDKILHYINPYLFQLGLGIPSIWILLWDCLELRGGMILFLW